MTEVFGNDVVSGQHNYESIIGAKVLNYHKIYSIILSPIIILGTANGQVNHCKLDGKCNCNYYKPHF